MIKQEMEKRLIAANLRAMKRRKIQTVESLPDNVAFIEGMRAAAEIAADADDYHAAIIGILFAADQLEQECEV